MSLFVPQPPATAISPTPEGTHDCRLEFISASVLRLVRFGGNRIMCNGVREVIPAAGIDMAPPALAPGFMFNVWCGPTGGIAGAPLYLVPDQNVPVFDAYGMPTHPTFPALTLVGCYLTGTGGAFQMAANIVGVASYWNRKLKALSTYINAGLGSTSPVELATGFRLSCVGFPGDPIRCFAEGFCNNSADGGYVYTRIDLVGIGALSALGQHQSTFPSGYGPVLVHADLTYPAGATYVITTIVGYVNAGSGVWWVCNSLLCWV